MVEIQSGKRSTPCSTNRGVVSAVAKAIVAPLIMPGPTERLHRWASEKGMLQRDLQARLAEMRRVTTQNEEHVKDLKACRADLFAREGRLGRVEAELAALQRSAQQVEVDLTVAKEQLERRKEELAKASMDNVKLRGQFESEKLRWQNTVNTIRATQQTEEEKTRNQHAREMEAS